MNHKEAARSLPIIMDGESVRAILAGRKTQTRRVVTDRTSRGNYRASEMKLDEAWVDPGPSPAGNPGPYLKAPPDFKAALPRLRRHGWTEEDSKRADQDGIVERLYPWVFPGDRLWVRETWRPFAWHDGEPIVVEFRAGGKRHECYTDDLEAEQRCIEWEEKEWIRISDELEAKGVAPDEDGGYPAGTQNRLSWRSPIFMPRWASRITLRVAGVRVERLQEITEDDAQAEGIRSTHLPLAGASGSTVWHAGAWPTAICGDDAVAAFACRWDSLNVERGHGWEANPWVWVVEFRVEGADAA